MTLSSAAALEIFDVPSPAPASPRQLAISALLALAVAVLGSLAGCSASGECRLSSDCPSPLFCAEGLCVAECREDRDCTAGDVCRSGRCAPKESGQRLCGTAIDCELGETCANGVCTRVRFVAPDAGTAAPPDMGTPDLGPADAGMAPVPDAGVGLPYGALCAAASDCESNLCLAPQGATTGRCTDRCTTDTDCFFPDTCLDVPGAGPLCGQAPAGQPVGAPCPGGPGDCASGLCVDTNDGHGPICTERCLSLPTCPPNMTCQPVPDGRGGAEAVCINGTGGGFGEACSVASDCATNLCVGVGNGGICTSLCSQVPCPTGYSCTLAEDASGQYRVCAPDGALGGGFGDPCTSASACRSNLCLFDQRTNAAFCTQRCLGNADCTSVPGLACVTLSSGVNVCGPL